MLANISVKLYRNVKVTITRNKFLQITNETFSKNSLPLSIAHRIEVLFCLSSIVATGLSQILVQFKIKI